MLPGASLPTRLCQTASWGQGQGQVCASPLLSGQAAQQLLRAIGGWARPPNCFPGNSTGEPLSTSYSGACVGRSVHLLPWALRAKPLRAGCLVVVWSQKSTGRVTPLLLEQQDCCFGVGSSAGQAAVCVLPRFFPEPEDGCSGPPGCEHGAAAASQDSVGTVSRWLCTGGSARAALLLPGSALI